MKKLTVLISIFVLFFNNISLSEFINLKIVPIKKPSLNKVEIEKRLAKEELRPLPKPIKEDQVDTKEIAESKKLKKKKK